MRLLICAGGTGGGVYPALAVHKALASQHAGLQTLWVGGEGGMESRLVERAGIPFRAIPAAGVHGVGLRQLPGNLAKLGRGAAASRRILREFQPDALFFTGGYVAVPMALAGSGTPTLLYVPDIEPGLALKTLARFADRIAVTAAESARYFSRRERVAVTGYPVRPELAAWTRPEARRALNLTVEAPVLLVFGGSKGARSINRTVLAHLPALLEMAQVIHISGELDWPEVEARAKELDSPRYHPFPYLHEEMGAALAAADLALSRAGASILGEYPLFGLPSILVPYPYAWRYQKVNADHLARNGAAILLEDARLAEGLLPAVKGLFQDPARLDSMRGAVKALAHPQAAAEIGRLLLELAENRR
jgi:UDP-N-acetylglucosamine--N-acetylmuramyl-(pentapeptide) pyrophosphoryl-undecaprenol N-acetylglucosamine transferase